MAEEELLENLKELVCAVLTATLVSSAHGDVIGMWL